MYNEELASKRYLIVDDYGDMRSMLKNMLKMFGVHKVVSVSNGKDAIATLEKEPIDVVLCDYNLGPGKDGQQVLEEAKHRELIGMGTIFVMITAENTREMVLGAMEYEPDSYLSKPFTKDMLQARLDKLAAKKMDLAAVQSAVQEKNLDLAIQLLEERIRQKPRNIAELSRYKAELCLQAGRYDKAAEVYEQALAIRELPWAVLGMGRVHYARGEFEDARSLFQDMIDENEDQLSAYDWLAKTLVAMDQADEAQSVLENAVELSPKAILRQKTLGEIALTNEAFECADAAFSKAVDLGKNSVFKNPDVYAKLANTKSQLDDNDDALNVIKQLEKEFGNDKEAQLFASTSQSFIYSNMGNEGLAQQHFQQAEKLFSRLGVKASTSATIEMAKACVSVGETEKGQEILMDAVRNNHDNDEVLKEVENAFHSIDPEGDIKDKIDSACSEIIRLNNQGVDLTQKGKLSEAIELFDQAATGMPGNRAINLNAAKVLILYMQKNGKDMDHVGKTRKYLDRVRKIEPDNPTLNRLQGALKKVVGA